MGWRYVFFIFVTVIVFGSAVLSEDAQLEGEWLLLEPQAMKIGELTFQIKGMKKSFFRPVHVKKERPYFSDYKKDDWEFMRIGWNTYAKRIGKKAKKLLAGIELNWVKGEDGVVRYAEIITEKPLVAGLLYVPSLAEVMKSELGENLLIVIPSRHQMFVFSAESEELQKEGKRMQLIFENAVYPASREVFLLKNGRLEVIGAIGG